MNVERAARDGAEIGGHPLSGHVDLPGPASSADAPSPRTTVVLRIDAARPAHRRYVFAKGYIAVNGCQPDRRRSAQRQRDGSGWFEVWLIPETLRMTTFGAKREGDGVNIEIERSTQVFVDTVRSAIDERLGPLLPLLEGLMQQQGKSLDELAAPPTLPLSR